MQKNRIHKLLSFISVLLLSSEAVQCLPVIAKDDTKLLQGNVVKHAASTRIQRTPQTQKLTSPVFKHQVPGRTTPDAFNSFLQHTDFQLPTKTTQKPDVSSATPFAEKPNSLSGGAHEDSSNPSFTTKAPLPSPLGSGGDTVSEPHESKAKHKQIIVIRLTYYMLDEQNPFYAFRFAEVLQQKHSDVEVVVLLEKEGVRCANKDLNTSFILRNEKQAHKLSDLVTAFMQQGGRVMVSRDWASSFGVSEANLIQGVQLSDSEAIGDLVIDATKILEY